MEKKIEVSELLNTAADVWGYLIKNGGINAKQYDEDLVKELRLNLSLPSSGNFIAQLKKSKISTEDFLIEFFRVAQPYAEMMSDLLRMFENAGANQTDKNLAITFDFSKDLPKLNFDLAFLVWGKMIRFYLFIN